MRVLPWLWPTAETPMARGRLNRKGCRKREDQYFAIPYSMARNTAFRSLSGPALKVSLGVARRGDNFISRGDLPPTGYVRQSQLIPTIVPFLSATALARREGRDVSRASQA